MRLSCVGDCALGVDAFCFLFVHRFTAFCLSFLHRGGTVCCEGTERGVRGFLGCGLFFSCCVYFGGGGFLDICSYSRSAIYLPSHFDLFPCDIDGNYMIQICKVLYLMFD